MKESSRLVLICGLPGAGKTTLSRRLAGEIPAVRLCADEWMTQLGIDLFDEDARTLVEAQFWRHAQELLALGQSVILESGFWSRAERDALREGARSLGVAVELHVLTPTVDELWRRLEARNEERPWGTAPIDRAQLEAWVPHFEAPDEAELALFDHPG